jgi:LacI family transcriptional regulator, kdg operon repressor
MNSIRRSPKSTFLLTSNEFSCYILIINTAQKNEKIMMQEKRYTITDIAKEVGVSITTVSRYLSGQYQYMSNDTKEKIRSVIRKYDYRPNLLAQGLKSKKSSLIGIIMPNVHTPTSSHSIRGICMACANTQYSPVFVSIENDLTIEPVKIQELVDHRVEGILCFTGSGEMYYRKVVNGGIPVVYVDRYSTDSQLDGVYINHYEIVHQSLHNLVVSGFTKIALFSSSNYIDNTYSTINIREKSYRDFIEKHLKSQHDIVYDIDENDIEDVKHKVLNFVESYPNDKKAVFVSGMSGLTSVGWVCKLLGLKYPEDLAVYGYAIQDDKSVRFSGLTAITQPLFEMTQTAFDLLVKRINGEELSSPHRIVIPAELIIRESTMAN